jgi:hypothetical protein
MYWPVASLSPELRDALARVAREGGLPGGSSWFRSRHRPGLMALLLLAAAGSTVLLVLGLRVALASGGTLVTVLLGLGAALGALWTLVLALELARGVSADVRPFVLLTPEVVVRADYPHGHMEAHRLADATDFKALNQYSGKQQFRARTFAFTFPGRVFSLTVDAGPDLDRVEGLLARARAGERDPANGAHLVPKDGGRPTLPALRNVSDPFGVFWAVVGGLLAVALIVGIIAARRS